MYAKLLMLFKYEVVRAGNWISGLVFLLGMLGRGMRKCWLEVEGFLFSFVGLALQLP